ncbi:zinc ribbon domain-containing protein [Rugamonas sp. DEMB1]|uniref:zinc ribbon domain-containing protein n=1 Tax=Rugamonas sp. DEMB1 TaxID=3039386 RepID=UPI00391D0F89
MANCGKCGTANKDGTKFCKACGSVLAAQDALSVANCPDCASSLPPGAKFCKKCGCAAPSAPLSTVSQEVFRPASLRSGRRRWVQIRIVSSQHLRLTRARRIAVVVAIH